MPSYQQMSVLLQYPFLWRLHLSGLLRVTRWPCLSGWTFSTWNEQKLATRLGQTKRWRNNNGILTVNSPCCIALLKPVERAAHIITSKYPKPLIWTSNQLLIDQRWYNPPYRRNFLALDVFSMWTGTIIRTRPHFSVLDAFAVAFNQSMMSIWIYKRIKLPITYDNSLDIQIRSVSKISKFIHEESPRWLNWKPIVQKLCICDYLFLTEANHL